MVTPQQVLQADPVFQKITKLNTLISGINQGAANGWQVSGVLTFTDNKGNPQTLDLSSIPPAILLNDLFALANNELTNQTANLASI